MRNSLQSNSTVNRIFVKGLSWCLNGFFDIPETSCLYLSDYSNESSFQTSLYKLLDFIKSVVTVSKVN